MKKHLIVLLFIIWLGKLPGQVWSPCIDSTAYPGMWFACGVEDTTTHILYLGGGIEKINNLKTKGIVKFNGTTFDSLGTGLDDHKNYVSYGDVRDMVMFQNKLYICGNFVKTGHYYCKYMGRWNGNSWDTVNFMPNNNVFNLKVYNNELYVGGYFDTIAGQHINNFAKFDGANWYDIGYPFKTVVSDFAMYKGKLYMAGQVTQSSSIANLAVYDGVSWQPWVGVSGDVNKTVWGTKVIDTMLYVYGRFSSIGGVNCDGLAAWNGTKWYGYGRGVGPSNFSTIRDISKINGDLYISGVFNYVDSVASPSPDPTYCMDFAKFDVLNYNWCSVSPAFDNAVDFSLKYNGDQYIFGAFWHIGNDSILKMAKWIGGNSTIACGQNIIIEGVNEIAISDNIKIYPNPATSFLTIKDDQNELRNATVEISNSLGQTVSSLNYTSNIDISGLPPGYYLIRIKGTNTIHNAKFIKE